MREIKFRAWCNLDNTMVPAMTLQEIIYSKENEFSLKQLNELFVFMQYTGLKDKNGVEIYDGDIVHWKDLESFDDFPIDEVLKVEYSDEFMKWITCNKNDLQDDLYDFTDNRDLEVIGNIYENPELVEEQTIIKEVE